MPALCLACQLAQWGHTAAAYLFKELPFPLSRKRPHVPGLRESCRIAASYQYRCTQNSQIHRCFFHCLHKQRMWCSHQLAYSGPCYVPPAGATLCIITSPSPPGAQAISRAAVGLILFPQPQTTSYTCYFSQMLSWSHIQSFTMTTKI